MAQELAEESPEQFDVQRYLDVMRRRYPLFLISVFVGWFTAWGVSWIMPASYKSGTLILVEEPTMPRDYVTPNINEKLQDRLQNITQQILSRTRLLHIIDQLNLYAEGRRHNTPDEKVELMRKDIQIELVRDAGNEITAFNVYYSAHDPRIAQRVTSELTQLFINENIETRQQQSEDTTKFLTGQLETARQSLSEQEARVREFKGQHVGELPSQQASNVQILSGLQAQLQNEQEALNAAQQQRVYLQTLIGQYRTLQGTSRGADGSPTGLPAIDKELDRLKAELANLSSQFTDQYPDVRSLKAQIAKTEKMRDELVADLKHNGNRGSQPDSASVTRDQVDLSDNPAMLQLQSQLSANQAEVANREQTINRLKAKTNDYQERLNQEPIREQQLADLTRGYDQSKANYDDLLKKENGSRMATSMEQMKQGERFRMLDPANLPLKPDSPNRLKFCGMGLGLGLALGILVALVSEFLDDRLYSEKEIMSLLPAKVISEIPEVLTLSDELRNKKRIMLGWAFAALEFAVILAGSAFSYRHS